ncbi:MAG TPA: hypothetical protein VFD43_08360 [Planctomycetota bacterium]|nr:hypothetical protein [Planctomycetota bacterium]
MHALRLTLPMLVAALVAGAYPAHAGVIVVAGDGSGDFLTLQPAIDAANEGDTILLRDPSVEFSFTLVDGKGLAIVGDVPVGSGGLEVVGNLVVRNLTVGQQVVLRNLAIDSWFPTAPAVHLQDNQGGVWIEDCTAVGGIGQGGAPFGCSGVSAVPGGAGVFAQDCDAVTIVDCALEGGPGSDAFDLWPLHFAAPATDGGPGVRVADSEVAIYDSPLTGGAGGGGSLCGEGGDGAFGLDLDNGPSKAFISGCTLNGGAAGSGLPGGGARAVGSTLEMLDSLANPAPGGEAFVMPPSSLTAYSGTARSFQVSSPLREGQAGTLHMQGLQGDFVGFLWSFNGGMLSMPARNGWFLIASGFLAGPFVVGGIAAPTGVADIPITGPNLPPAAEEMSFLLQAYFVHVGGVTLGSGTAFTLVDQTL